MSDTTEQREKAHEVRKRVSAAMEVCEHIRASLEEGAATGRRELALVITKLQEARMWAGKLAGELGSALPEGYPHDHASADEFKPQE